MMYGALLLPFSPLRFLTIISLCSIFFIYKIEQWKGWGNKFEVPFVSLKSVILGT